MSWTDVYLTCFVIGFALSFVSFLLGSFHLHLPHMHFHGGAHVHFDLTHGTPTAMHPAPGHAQGASEQLSLFNFGTVAAFLAWFGGAGYLLTRYSGLWIGFVLLISSMVGFVGASIIFFFVAKVLMRYDSRLDPADYDMVGVLGTVTLPIREAGTGEIVFSQEGARRCAGARSDNAVAIPKGTEVVVTRYERGIAYVQRWDELAGTAQPSEQEKGSKQ
jgi:membrane protein implicated in regulation of membrane protease activity